VRWNVQQGVNSVIALRMGPPMDRVSLVLVILQGISANDVAIMFFLYLSRVFNMPKT
jgi:hypothetical protein